MRGLCPGSDGSEGSEADPGLEGSFVTGCSSLHHMLRGVPLDPYGHNPMESPPSGDGFRQGLFNGRFACSQFLHLRCTPQLQQYE